MNINPLEAPKDEASIIKHWKYTDKIYISCVCITYNQENYIKDAINGMLAQITDYRFEVVIHDDVSTDNTRDILLEYKNKYPNIIKLVLQKENQYKKGKKIIPLAVSKAQGEYIALCEGDDYWLNKSKIDTQIKTLNQYNKINICVHSAYVINTQNNRLINVFKFKTDTSKIVPPIKIYSTSGQFSPTAAYFFRREVFLEFMPLYDNFPILDFFIEAILGNNGVFYLKHKWSAYRYNAIGSWTTNELNDINLSLIRNEKMLKSLELLNYTMGNTLEEKIEYKKSYIYRNIITLHLKKRYYIKAFSYLTKIKKNKIKNYSYLLYFYLKSILKK
ncbi:MULTISPECIES: glycosyltransferase family 2 protein [Providencia]|uniref:glycosyltransferase family 2 protein n=1 Tax=Providencia TaxID=586 RepID=UPI0023493047|nr:MULTISPECIES: glycosyltransferase [unclassified Providencia]